MADAALHAEKSSHHAPLDPRIEALVNEVIGRVADKWTMIVLEVLTDMGHSLSEAFCGVWTWAEAHLDRIETARQAFDARRIA